MKKLLAAALLACLLIPAAAGAEGTGRRELTVMVYMCGSDLESEYGCASLDLMEMQAAGFDDGRLTVLVMTGGAARWALGGGSGTAIRRIRPGGQQIVWQSDQRDMGDPATLRHLLEFGLETCPAEDYALILWDHGGGPLEGVCRDELFAMDGLTLPELTDALREGIPGKKLGWIGFDACLMSSVEVASAMAPCAEYMIASQETEPSSGWNYSFLAGIAGLDGAQAGRRIVDAYFDGAADEKGLTLACLDLSRIQAVEEAMATFFGGLDARMDEGGFSALANGRMASAAFGKAVLDSGETDYDLADLSDLAGRLQDGSPSADDLRQAVANAVVYARSGSGPACGMSVYHPFANKSRYAGEWKQAYAGLRFCPEYTAYISRFGSILTGDHLAPWRDLYTVSGPDRRFSLQLSADQAAHFSSAQLMILMAEDPAGGGCTLVSSAPAAMDENGLITAEYDGAALYAVAEKGGRIGPLSFLARENSAGEGYNALAAFYLPGDKGLESRRQALYEIEPQQNGARPEILDTKVLDTVSGSYTGRIPFSEEGMGAVLFWTLDRIMPSDDGSGVLPAFGDWEADLSRAGADGMRLPDSWHFEYISGLVGGTDLFAVFQVTDTQHNSYCSVPVPVDNPNVSAVEFPSALLTGEAVSAELSAYIISAPDEKGLRVRLSVTNPTEKTMNYTLKDIRLNASRAVSGTGMLRRLLPHETGFITVDIGRDELYRLDAVSSVAGVLACYDAADAASGGEEVFSFSCVPASAEAVAPRPSVLAETVQDGAEIRLLDLEPAEYGFKALLYVSNRRSETLKLENVLCDGLGISGNAVNREVAPQTDAVIETDIDDALWLVPAEARLYLYPDQDSLPPMLVLASHVLERNGIDAVSRLQIGAGGSQKDRSMEMFTLDLKEPWPVRESGSGRMSAVFDTLDLTQRRDVLREGESALVYGDRYTVSLQAVCFRMSGAVLLVKIVNEADTPLWMEYEDIALGGADAVSVDRTAVAPHSICYELVCFRARDVGPSAEESFGTILLRARGDAREKGSQAVIRFHDPVPYGASEILILTEKDWEAEPAVNEPAAEAGQAFVFEERAAVPDDAGRYRVWIPAPLSREEQAEIAGGWMTVADPAGGDMIRLVLQQSLQQDDQGRWGVRCPGLALCIDGDMEYSFYTRLSANGGDTVYTVADGYASVFSLPQDDNPDLDMITDITALKVTLDHDSDAARITGFETSGSLGTHQEDLKTVQLATYILVCQENENGTYPALEDIPFYTGFDWYLSLPQYALNDKPARLTLTPLESLDRLLVLFSFERKDGTGYSLPPVPWNALQAR